MKISYYTKRNMKYGIAQSRAKQYNKKSIIGQQDSSLVKEYDNGGKHYDFTQAKDYSYEGFKGGENLKGDWLWENVSKPFVSGVKWLGEGMVPSSLPHLLALTGGGAAISGVVKQAPKLLSLIKNSNLLNRFPRSLTEARQNFKTNISSQVEQVGSLGRETDQLLYNLIKGNKWQSTAQRNVALKSGSDFTSKWHADPVTQQKLKNLNIQSEVNTAITKGHHKTTIPTYKQWTQNYTMPGHKYGGWSQHRLQEMPKSGCAPVNYVNPIRSRTMSPRETGSLAVHEGGTHGIYESSTMYRNTKLGEIFKKDVISKVDFLKKASKPKNWDKLSKTERANWGKEAIKDYRYLSSPNEMHARINEIRYGYYYSPGEKITTKEAAMILEDIKLGKTHIDRNWAKLFKTPDALKKMMNTAPAALPVAATTLQE